MKIDATQTLDLLERMREAASAAPAEHGSFEGIRGTDTAPPATASSPLEASLRTTAERALRGEFSDAAAVRGEVVEQILRERWTQRVGEDKVAEMIDELSANLVDDPEFQREIDEMLVVAARTVSTR